MDIHEQIHQERIASHEAIVAKLCERKKGDKFKDAAGVIYIVVRVDDKFPRPGYVGRRTDPRSSGLLFFVGFDSVEGL